MQKLNREEIRNRDVKALDLSDRAYTVLRRAGLKTIGDIQDNVAVNTYNHLCDKRTEEVLRDVDTQRAIPDARRSKVTNSLREQLRQVGIELEESLGREYLKVDKHNSAGNRLERMAREMDRKNASSRGR